jgi:hypothetical protein
MVVPIVLAITARRSWLRCSLSLIVAACQAESALLTDMA